MISRVLLAPIDHGLSVWYYDGNGRGNLMHGVLQVTYKMARDGFDGQVAAGGTRGIHSKNVPGIVRLCVLCSQCERHVHHGRGGERCSRC